MRNREDEDHARFIALLLCALSALSGSTHAATAAPSIRAPKSAVQNPKDVLLHRKTPAIPIVVEGWEMQSLKWPSYEQTKAEQ